MNLYGYVWNNPTTFVDPYGLWGFNWPDAVTPPIGGTSCAVYFLVSNFYKLRTVNNRGADKYYHCLAFCQIGKQCGITGLGAAITGGVGKEFIDCLFPTNSCEPINDTRANFLGIAASENLECCKKSCKEAYPF